MAKEFVPRRYWLYLVGCMIGFGCGPTHKTAAPPSAPAPRQAPPVQARPVQAPPVASAPPRPEGHTDPFMEKLLGRNPAYFKDILRHRDSLEVQIIYTQIDRGANNFPTFRDYCFNVDSTRYFYPASTVKLPVALLALQHLQELKVPGLDWTTTMLTDTAYDGQTMALNDPTSVDGRPSVGQYVKRIFLTSDNDAFNRLYEWLGPAYINTRLHRMGYTDVQIRHRLNVVLREDQNRRTNPVRFLDAADRPVWQEPAKTDTTNYISRADTVGGVDFSRKNRISLNDLHEVLRSVLFPETVPEARRFDIGADGYKYLYRCMSELPGETRYPAYDSAEIWDTYVKYVLFGGRKVAVPRQIRIFNKIGQAYGYLLDVAYVIDTAARVEFMVSAVIRCNRDGQPGDGHYTYDSLGFPFLQHLGEVLYRYELERPRKYRPDLSSFEFTYDR